MNEVTLTAQRRQATGKEKVKRLRGAGLVPAVVYGHGKPAINLTIKAADLVPIFKTSTGKNVIIKLVLEGENNDLTTIIRYIQTEPINNRLLHLDLLEIKLAEKIKVKVFIELTGTPEGVKNQGGILEHILDAVEISCLPMDIPEKIVVDVSPLKVGQSIHLSDLSLDKVDILDSPTQVVATVISLGIEEEAPAATAAAAETAEPEVISKGKKEEEEEAKEK